MPGIGSVKRVGGVDWLINVIGFGMLTIWAGWEISGRPMEFNYLLIFKQKFSKDLKTMHVR